MKPRDLAEALDNKFAPILLHAIVVVDLPFEDDPCAEHGLSFGTLHDFPHFAFDLTAHLVLEHTAPLQSLDGRFGLEQGGWLFWQIARGPSRHGRYLL